MAACETDVLRSPQKTKNGLWYDEYEWYRFTVWVTRKNYNYTNCDFVATASHRNYRFFAFLL